MARFYVNGEILRQYDLPQPMGRHAHNLLLYRCRRQHLHRQLSRKVSNGRCAIHGNACKTGAALSHQFCRHLQWHYDTADRLPHC